MSPLWVSSASSLRMEKVPENSATGRDFFSSGFPALMARTLSALLPDAILSSANTTSMKCGLSVLVTDSNIVIVVIGNSVGSLFLNRQTTEIWACCCIILSP